MDNPAQNGTTSSLEITFIQHEEGRFRPTGSEMIYEYNLTDHLGNTRITFGDANADGLPEMLQENDYYPFGMAMTMSSTLAAAPPNNYLYNGKELQNELDLGWYDYGARMYDASIGRWNGVDALAEKYTAWSPYNYTLGSPIRFIDPDGKKVYIKLADGSIVEYGESNHEIDDDFYKSVKASISFSMKYDEKNVWNDLISSEKPVLISFGKKPQTDGNESEDGESFTAVFIEWDPSMAKQQSDDLGAQSPSTVLYHEAAHAQRRVSINSSEEMDSFLLDKATPVPNYTNREEFRVITQYETPYINAVNAAIGYPQQSTRDFHTGININSYKSQGVNSIVPLDATQKVRGVIDYSQPAIRDETSDARVGTSILQEP